MFVTFLVHACSAPFHARSLKLFFYFIQTHVKETQLGNYVLCAKYAFVRQSLRVLS